MLGFWFLGSEIASGIVTLQTRSIRAIQKLE